MPYCGVMLLGVPTIFGRLIHQILTSLFDPEFSDSSCGFRPVGRARHCVARGYTQVVAMDNRQGAAQAYQTKKEGGQTAPV